MLRWTLPCLLLLAACGGSDDPTRPPETLDGFQLEFANQVLVYTPVELTVRAVGDAGTSPFTGFSGTVELALDQGRIEPASLELAEGIGTTTVTITGTDEPPTLTVRSGERTGTLTFAIGRFESTGTVSVSLAKLSPQAEARIQLPGGALESDQGTVYDVLAVSPLSKSILAEQDHEGREGTWSARSLAQFDSRVLSSETQLSVTWTTVSSAAATGVSPEFRADGAGGILGNLSFEILDEPLIYELEIRTSRQADKGATSAGGISLVHTAPGGEVSSIVNLSNTSHTSDGLLEPGTYALRFDASAIVSSGNPEPVVAKMDFDVRLLVYR